MAAGFRSPLAIWAGGAGTHPTQAGVRSPFAFWLGGACAVVPTGAQAGVRSLMAFWAGGAATLAGITPPVIHPGGGFRRQPQRFRIRPRDDEELFLLISAALHVLNNQ